MNVTAFIITVKNNSRIREIEKTVVALSLAKIKIVFFNGVEQKKIIYDKTNDNITKLIYENDEIFLDNKFLSENKTFKGNFSLGCSWSHINVYKRILNENNPNMKYLIFEDDAWFDGDISLFVQSLINHLNNIPENFDLCHLGNSDFNPFYKIDKINNYFYTIVKFHINNGHSYLVSLKGVEKILEYNNNIIKESSDDLIASCLQFISNFNFYVPENPLFIQKPNVKSICTGIPNKITTM